MNENNNSSAMNCYQSGNSLNVAASNLANNDQAMLELFDLNGKLISSEKVAATGGQLNTSIDVANVASGFYFVRLGNAGYHRIVKVAVNQ
jgi:Secretion system C-terminal sorting domain